MSSNSGTICSRSWPLAPSAIARAWRTRRPSFAAYSGSRSGPRITTASTIRAMNSQPLTPAMTLLLLARAGQREGDADRLAAATHLHRHVVAHALGPDRDDQVVGIGH